MKQLILGFIFVCAAISCGAQTNNTKSQTFAILLSVDEKPLMTNATFTKMYGLKAMFTNDQLVLRGFDVRTIDSNQIAKLKIDLGKAVQAQARINAQKLRQQGQDAEQHSEMMDAMWQAALNREKFEAVEAAKAAVAARQKFEDDLRIQAAQNDALKAQAAIIQAKAALIQAQNPTVINQSTTVIGR